MRRTFLVRLLPPLLWLLAVACLGRFVAWRAPTTVLLATGSLVDPVAIGALVALLGLRLAGLAALGPWLVGSGLTLWHHARATRSPQPCRDLPSPASLAPSSSS